MPIADSLCTSPPKTSPRSSTPTHASSTDGADPAPVVSPRRSQSVRQSSDGGGQRTSPRNSPRRTAAGSMIALGSGSADRATTSPGESPRGEGETKEERAKMRGALLELEELQKAKEFQERKRKKPIYDVYGDLDSGKKSILAQYDEKPERAVPPSLPPPDTHDTHTTHTRHTHGTRHTAHTAHGGMATEHNDRITD